MNRFICNTFVEGEELNLQIKKIKYNAKYFTKLELIVLLKT